LILRNVFLSASYIESHIDNSIRFQNIYKQWATTGRVHSQTT